MGQETRAHPEASRWAAAFVGRERELESLRFALAGAGSVAVVEGEAGIGKTRLVTESLQAPELDRLRVLHVVCPPLEEPFPLGAVVDALHDQPIDELTLSPLAGALRPLFPEWAERLPPAPEPLEDPRAIRHRLLRALAELVQRLAIDVIVVDDAHWADTSTLELLLLLSAAATSDVRLVITFRPTDVPDESLLLRLTSRAPGRPTPIRIALDTLDVDETADLVSSLFGTHEVSSQFVAFLHERTEGVPLAVEESLSLLRDRGDIVWRGGEWTRRAVEELEVPPTVRDSVLERVTRLAGPTRQVLAAAAVLAEAADVECLRRVAALDPGDTHDALAAALEAGLLREASPGMFVFRHVLAARAVEEATPISERRRMHAAAASALAGLSPQPVGRLARHCREAGDLDAWSEHAEATADLAMRSGDDRAAVLLLLELLAAPHHAGGRRVHLVHKLATASAWGVAALGEVGARVVTALSSALDEAGDQTTSEVAEARLLLGRLLLQLGEFDAAAAQISRAVEHLDGRPMTKASAMISLAWPRGHAWSADRHREWLERAEPVIDQVAPGEDRTWLEVDRASVHLMLGDKDAWAAAARLASGDGTLAERRQVARLLMNMGHVGIAWGLDEDARDRLGDAIRLMEETGYRRLLNSAHLTRCYLDWHRGAWEGLADEVRSRADEDSTLPEARLEARQTLGLLAFASGDREYAEKELRFVLEEAIRRGVADGQPAPAAALARGHLSDGDLDRALELTRPAMDMVRLKHAWLWAGHVAVVHLDVLTAGGDLAEAELQLGLLESGVGPDPAPAARASLTLARGILAGARGDLRQAAAAFGDAAATWSTLPRPFDAQLARERQGVAWLGAGDRQEGLDELQSVQQELRGLGARWDADRVARMLRDHGVEVARVWRGGRRGYGNELSPRELDVARLVARGMTNRQVADALFLSPRTVDRHLGAVMKKLGVRSRTAVAVTMTADGAASGDDTERPPGR